MVCIRPMMKPSFSSYTTGFFAAIISVLWTPSKLRRRPARLRSPAKRKGIHLPRPDNGPAPSFAPATLRRDMPRPDNARVA